MSRLQCTANNFRSRWCHQWSILWCGNYICHKNWYASLCLCLLVSIL